MAIKSTTELGILLILPLVYHVFDYATNVYTTLFHSGSVVTVEFLAFALCAFYLMFLAVYLCEYEEKETAERERWMLETRDSAAIKELEAWRQSGRELSILRHDMRHFLRGLAALIEEATPTRRSNASMNSAKPAIVPPQAPHPKESDSSTLTCD